ncbi:MAG: NADH-quinone oxidoreductase subunit K [Gemmatimonadota bacterium]
MIPLIYPLALGLALFALGLAGFALRRGELAGLAGQLVMASGALMVLVCGARAGGVSGEVAGLLALVALAAQGVTGLALVVQRGGAALQQEQGTEE